MANFTVRTVASASPDLQDLVGLLGPQTFSLSDSGITSVTIGSADTSFWDFAIDDVQFTPIAATAEPKGPLPVLSALGVAVLLAQLARRRGFLAS